MKGILVRPGYTALVDDVDYQNLVKYRWFAARRGNLRYAVANVTIGNQRKQQYMHRMLLNVHGFQVEVDHKDGNGLNNQRSNLRIASHQENQRNKRRYARNKTGFRGVSFHKATGKYRASMTVNGKHLHLGLFISAEEASCAYQAKAKYLHGQFYRKDVP